MSAPRSPTARRRTTDLFADDHMSMSSTRFYGLDHARRRVLGIALGIFVTVAVLATLGVTAAIVYVGLTAVTPRQAFVGPFLAATLVMAAITSVVLVRMLGRLGDIGLYVSESHLEYRDFGLVMRTSWDNCVRIGIVPIGAGYGEGIVLREPAEVRGNVLTRLDVRVRRRDRAIPFSFVMWWWRETSLGDDLRRYAPWLMSHPSSATFGETSHLLRLDDARPGPPRARRLCRGATVQRSRGRARSRFARARARDGRRCRRVAGRRHRGGGCVAPIHTRQSRRARGGGVPRVRSAASARYPAESLDGDGPSDRRPPSRARERDRAAG